MGGVAKNRSGQGMENGCEVWVNLNTPWATVRDKPVKFTRDHVNIVYADHRCIIVRCMCRYINMYIISAHAPYVGCSDDPCVWWPFLFLQQWLYNF